MKTLHDLRDSFTTQYEMAMAVGVSQPTVNGWLKGNKKPSFKVAKRIEERFGIPKENIRPDIYG